MSNQIIRSAVTTFLTTLIGLVPLSALLNQDFSWVQSAVAAAVLATVRTVIAYIDPGNTAFGVGSTTFPDTPGDQASA